MPPGTASRPGAIVDDYLDGKGKMLFVRICPFGPPAP